MPTDVDNSEEFEQEREKAKAAQGLTSPDAVPEQRPQAFQERVESQESDLHRKRKERGDLDPMPQEAFDRASSSAQLRRAHKQEKKLGPETLLVGTRVRITDGDYEGSTGAITEVEYVNQTERQKAVSGDPAIARFAKASSYFVRTRGGGHALVNVEPSQVERISVLGINQSVA